MLSLCDTKGIAKLFEACYPVCLVPFALSLCDTKGTAEPCEACDPVCLVLRAEFVNEHLRIYKFG